MDGVKYFIKKSSVVIGHLLQAAHQVLLVLKTVFRLNTTLNLHDSLSVRVHLTALKDLQVSMNLFILTFDSPLASSFLEVFSVSVKVKHLSHELVVNLLLILKWRELHVELAHHALEVLILAQLECVVSQHFVIRHRMLLCQLLCLRVAIVLDLRSKQVKRKRKNLPG